MRRGVSDCAVLCASKGQISLHFGSRFEIPAYPLVKTHKSLVWCPFGLLKRGDQDTEAHGAFPSEDAALKMMYLAVKNLASKLRCVHGWGGVHNRFAVLREVRFPQHRSQPETELQPDRLRKRVETTE